jgi:1,4-dihydroxy-2-naphthoate polyprenyltransferase
MAKLIHLARPQFLIASLALFIIGAFWAILLGSPYSFVRLLLGYLIILPAHLSVSFSNDYYDVEVDKHGDPTFFSGGSGVLVKHPQLRKPALWIAIGLNVCSLGLGILFLRIYSYPPGFLGFTVISNLVGWIYSAPPFRLAYRGLGELLTAFTAGCLLPGMGYLVARGSIDGAGLLFAIPLIMYGLAFILSVEIPDVEVDRLGHKWTWVARLGRGFGFTAAAFLMLAGTGFFFFAPYLIARPFPLDFRLLGFLSLLPLGISIFSMVKKPSDKQTATRLVNGMIIALAAFLIFTDAYMVLAAAHKIF